MTRRKRLLVAFAFSGVGLAIACCAAIHVIVSTRILRHWVNTSPEELLLDYEAASAWVPGLIRIRGLTMRGSDRNVQWFFRMERATISVSLLDLLRKRFHATHVRASGLVFRLRERVEKADVSSAHLDRIPKIPGFADPPLKLETPEAPPPPPVARRRFWRVHIEDLVADPTPDIWIEIYRFRGHARVTGGFSLRPHVEARVGPAAVSFLSGGFALAPEDPILTTASGHADCTIEPFAPDEVQGVQVWPRISGAIRLEGRLEDLRFWNHFLRRSRQPRLEGGGGRAHIALRFVHGIGQGRGDFQAETLVARYGEQTLRGRVKGRFEVPRWDVEHDHLEISGSRIALDDVATTGTRHDERDWWGRFDFVSGRIRGDLSADTAVTCRDARPLYTVFRADLPGWAQGILKLQGLQGKGHVRLARDLVEVRDFQADGGRFHIEGLYREKKEERHGAFLIETGSLALGIAIDGPASHLKLIGARRWFRQTSSADHASP